MKKFKFGSCPENLVFAGLVCLIFVTGAYSLVKTPSKTSVAENRTLAQFQHFTLKIFLNGSFQSGFEDALSDQFINSENIRTVYGEAVGNLPTYGIDRLVCENRYILLSSKWYTNTIFNCDDFIIPPPMTEDPRTKNSIVSGVLEKNIARYNHINTITDAYYYFIEEPQSFDFSTGQRVLDVETTLREKLTGPYKMSSLQFDSYDEMKELYYKTDHHWNQFGQQKGYQGIVELLDAGTPSTPAELVTNHELFYGTRARDSLYLKVEEEFAYFHYDLPTHDTYVNRNPLQYGHQEDYSEHNYRSAKLFSHYAYVFGGDSGEVMYDYHRPELDNILIISNSFDNPINSLIAQHFNRTYAVDLRNYQRDLGKKFVLSEYLKANDIDKVLLIVQPRFVFDDRPNQGLEL